MSRFDLGWNVYFEAIWQERAGDGFSPARVVSQQRGLWRVAGDFAECWAEASGKLRERSEEGGDWPAVGDWTAVELRAGDERALMHEVLPRRSQFVRKAAGKQIVEQVIAANIDTAIIVVALDGDFNTRRIERYLAQRWESGARPVVALNKADACAGPEALAAETERIVMGAPVFLLSARTGDGVSGLDAYLAKGQTIVLLGSSGAGKSTLVNRLAQQDLQPTQPVRESDSRGRHTTTARQLFTLSGGAMVIDTPGLRELQLWDAADGLAQAFADVDAFSAQCRFRDCRHGAEPGCAVQTALQEGTLDASRLENLRKLEREQNFLLRKIDPAAREESKNRFKILQREMRRKYQQREKGKG